MSRANDEQPLLTSFWRKIIASPVTPRVTAAVVCFILIFAITANHLAHPKLPRLKVGDVAGRDYVANESITYIDTEATNAARDNAAGDVLPVYSIDIVKNNLTLSNIKNFFDTLSELSNELAQAELLAGITPVESDQPEEETGEVGPMLPEIDVEEIKAQAVLELVGSLDSSVSIPRNLLSPVSEPDLLKLLSLDNNTRETLRTIIDESIKIRIAGDRIDEEDIPSELDTLKTAVADNASENLIDPEYADIASRIACYFLRSNAVLDLDATETARAVARDNTVPVVKEVSRSQTFLRHGEVVRQEHVDILNALGMTTGTETRSPWLSIIFFGLVLLITFILGAGFLTAKTFPMLKDPRYYLLFYTILVITYLASFFLVQSFSGLTRSNEGQVLVIFASLPIIGAAVLLAHYFSRLMAITISGFLAVVVSLAAGNTMIIIPTIITSIAAAIVITRDCPKPRMIRAFFVLPLIWFCAFFSEIFITGLNISEMIDLRWFLILSVTPAPLAMILASYVLDGAFNIPTSSRLAEFDNQDHPLLKKLQLEAPGTWHHSMMVGLIAEAACQVIGGNTHMVRIACMYHDIGKVRRPEFFIENQHGGINLHDKYSPWLSKIIVESHVKDGMAMAKAHGLPRELVETIPQHHGTSLITYFFRKALAISEDGYVNEYDYRYPGPKPQTPEAACINLADAAESATRSLEEPTPHRIESLVSKIYEERLLDGQYDECSLALNQLEAIKVTIIDRLIGAYHTRIDYPEEEELRRQLQLKRAEGDKSVKNGAPAEKEE